MTENRLLQIAVRYDSGHEETEAPIVLGQPLTTFLQARPVDRVTKPFVTPSNEPIAWKSYSRIDWDGQIQPGWVGKSSTFECFSTAPSPPDQPVLLWAQLRRPAGGSALWFPDDLRPVTGSVAELRELRLVVEKGTATGVDRWVGESTVVSSVESTHPRRLLDSADNGDRTLVAIIMTITMGRQRDLQ